MTKVYKINGKEIQGFEGRKIQSTFGEGVELPVEQAKINELLEALSDKEEVKPCRGCELHALENMTGFIPNKCVGDCKPKQEECEHEISSKQVHDNKGTYHIAGNTCLKCGLHELDWGTKPEQEECKTCGCKDQDWNEPCLDGFHGEDRPKEEKCERCKFDKLPGEYTLPFQYEIKHTCKEVCDHKRYGLKSDRRGVYCLDCDTLLGLSEEDYLSGRQLKQSTSLKEVPLRDKIDFIQDRLLNDHITTEESITEILEVVQSHLIKEVENECQVYACSRKCGGISPRCILDTDIIKIINNI